MSTLSVIRAGIIGVAAVALPSAAYGTALVFTLRGAGPFLGFLGVAVALVGALAWTCVRSAHFPGPLAIVLTTLPFAAATLLTVSALITGDPAGFVLQAVILACAGCVAWAGTHLAKR
jgi:hypothetical protein